MNPTPAGLLLRPARADEARAMARLSRDWIETGLAWKYTPVRMAELIADRETIALVAGGVSGASAAGNGGGRAARPSAGPHPLAGFAVMRFDDTEAHLVLLCVAPAWQRRGIGRGLNDWLTASARVAGIGEIHLEQRADNDTALAFYKSLGFNVAERLPGYYGPGIDALRMSRHLRQDAATS